MCVVYLLSEQTKLRQVGGRFLLEKKGKRQASIPMDEVECVIQGKAAEITTPAIYELLARGVCIFYVDGRGRLLGQLGQFASSNLSWERSRIQYDTVRDEQRQVELTREIVRLKMNGQIELLRSYAKSKKDLELAYLADEVRKYRKKLAVTSAIEELRGLEGMASRRYFEAFPMILDSKSWNWNGRNRRPPENPVNEQDRRCLLAYAEQKLFRKGLSEAKIWDDLTRIGKDAERVTKRYRNRAAHINAIRHQEARECMDFLIDVQQVMVWMMHEFA